MKDDQKVRDVVAGKEHILLVLENGEVLSFGRNHKGQLGLGHTGMTLGPAKIPGLVAGRSAWPKDAHSAIPQ